MATCDKCGSVLGSDEHRTFHDLLLCEDCYLDQVHRPTLKAESKNGRVNFLLRLKETYTLKKQEID